MPDELVRTVRDFAGAAMFDRYIAAAVAQRLRLDVLNELSAKLPPVPVETEERLSFGTGDAPEAGGDMVPM